MKASPDSDLLALTPAAIRSMLFVPGSSPERFPKALASPADLVCLDLEDAVVSEAKCQVRSAVLDYVASSAERHRLCIRLNRLGSVEGFEDAAALIRATARPGFVLLPKVESPRELELLSQALAGGSLPHLMAMIESPLGVEHAFEIARSPVALLVFGSFDYAADTGCVQEWQALLPVRSRIVAAAASAGKLALDSPYAALDDLPGAASEAHLAQGLGFTGKAAIHPKFLPELNAAFTPTVQEVQEAQNIVDAFVAGGAGAMRIGDKFIDAPVVRRMQRVLGRAAAASSRLEPSNAHAEPN